MKGRRKNSIYDTCRSFFIYKDGLLFVQKVNYSKPLCRVGQPLIINMKGATIRGLYVKSKGTGFVLSDWTISRKEGNEEWTKNL